MHLVRVTENRGGDRTALVLSLDEQRAILDFAERRETISEQRSAELAGILADAIGSRQDDAVQALYRYANWLQRG